MSDPISIHWVRPQALDDSCLSETERARAQRFRSPESRQTFVTARIRLRVLLAERLGISAAAVPIQVEKGGKPMVEGCEFNLSHAGDWICIAIGSCALGVDIERIRQRNWEVLAPRVFCEAEQRRIASTAIEATAMWSAKEALLKATGLGIRRTLRDLDVSAVQGDSWCEVEPPWHAQLLIAPEGYRAAIAAAEPVPLCCNGWN